jgi:hypothetical protein
MAFKPVGVDENGDLPPRVRVRLADIFVTKPEGIEHGQVPVWDANTGTWIPGSSEWSTQPVIDGGTPG